MGTLLQDIRHGLRVLRKSPGFTAVAVLSLALGIGANTTIFTAVNAVLLNPLPVKDASRLVEVDTIDSKTQVTAANFNKLGLSYLNYKDYREQNDVFSGILNAVVPTALTLSNPTGEPRQVTGLLVSANYFDVLGVPPALGRTFLPDEDQKPGGNSVVVLCYSLWAQKFGADPGIVGQTITLNGVGYTVIGVAAREFKGTFGIGQPDLMWIPNSMHDQALTGVLQSFFETRRALITTSIARLKPGVSIGQADAAMKTIAQRLEREYPTDNSGRSVTLTPLAETAGGANQHAQLVRVGSLMMGVVGLVLLIACANLANLLLAQAAKREKEMSIRAALGASSSRLMRQMLTESLLLSLSGGAVGLLLAVWGRALLWAFRPPFLPEGSINMALDVHVLGFTLGLSLLTGLLFGLVPAIKVSRPDLNEALKVGGRGGTLGWSRNRFRSLLVITEIALALVALVGAGLFVRSMQNAQKVDPGFESKHLFVFGFDLGSQHYLPEHGQQYYRDAIERARGVPGVEGVAVASNFPLGGGFMRTVFREGEQAIPGKRGTLVVNDLVSPSYFQTLRIPLVRGREFNDLDTESTTQVAIVSEAMAKHFWPNEDAIGKRFIFFRDTFPREIVGVVRDATTFQIGEDPQPLIYLPLRQNYSPAATLQVRTSGDPRNVLATVRGQVQDLDRNLAITNANTIGELLDQGLWAPRMGAVLLSLFGLLALVLAAGGIYGVMSYSVSQRTQEVGIRMALGAQPRHVMRLIIGEGLRIALIGLLAGLVAAAVLTRLLASLLFGVGASDPLTFAGVTLLLGAVAILACYIPARRAMAIDPIVALRYE